MQALQPYSPTVLTGTVGLNMGGLWRLSGMQMPATSFLCHALLASIDDTDLTAVRRGKPSGLSASLEHLVSCVAEA